MGEQEAIVMAAADVVNAWRRMDSVSRRYVDEMCLADLVSELMRLDDAVANSADDTESGEVRHPAPPPAAVVVRIADIENRYANMVVLPLDGTVIGLAIRLPENAVIIDDLVTEGTARVQLRLQASAMR